MVQAQQSPEAVPTATNEPESKREQSTIDFPYFDLDQAAKVAKAIFDFNGGSCSMEQVAAQMGESANSSGFRMKVSAAKTFGLVTTGQGMVTLTSLGTQVCNPQQEKDAKIEAFLKVPLYSAVFEKFKVGVLPPNSGLEAAIVSLGVAQKQKERARQVLQRSATSAGFFAFGTTKLVMPPRNAAPTPALETELEPEPDKKRKEDEPPPKKRHPLIEGLLQELPEPQEGGNKTEWPTEERRKWLEMVSTIFNVIYKDSDDRGGTLRVVIEKSSSAK